MNKDKQRLLQKLYEALDMCIEQSLDHEYSLISMAAGCIDADYIFEPTKEEKDTKQLGFDPDIHL